MPCLHTHTETRSVPTSVELPLHTSAVPFSSGAIDAMVAAGLTPHGQPTSFGKLSPQPILRLAPPMRTPCQHPMPALACQGPSLRPPSHLTPQLQPRAPPHLCHRCSQPPSLQQAPPSLRHRVQRPATPPSHIQVSPHSFATGPQRQDQAAQCRQARPTQRCQSTRSRPMPRCHGGPQLDGVPATRISQPQQRRQPKQQRLNSCLYLLSGIRLARTPRQPHPCTQRARASPLQHAHVPADAQRRMTNRDLRKTPHVWLRSRRQVPQVALVYSDHPGPRRPDRERAARQPRIPSDRR